MIRLKAISHDAKTWEGKIGDICYDDTAAKWKGEVTLSPTPTAASFMAAIESATYEGLPAAAVAALTA